MIRALAPIAAVCCFAAACASSATAPAKSAPLAASLSKSTIFASADSLVADGAESATIVVTLADSTGARLHHSGGVVRVKATAGLMSPAVDHQDGTYIAMFYGTSAAGGVTFTATLNDAPLVAAAALQLVGGPVDLAHTRFIVGDSTTLADGISTIAVLVLERDVFDNPTSKSEGTVTFESTIGTVGVVVPIGTGLFQSSLRSSVIGTATVVAKVGGKSVGTAANVRFTGGFYTERFAMPQARRATGSGAVNGILYVVGGGDWDVTSYTNGMFAYDPTINRWSSAPPMPTPRGELAVGVVNGILYAVGGYHNEDLATVEAYDPSTKSWTTKTPMPTARDGLAVGVINGILYAVGGNQRHGTSLSGAATRIPGRSDNGLPTQGVLNALEAYDPATDTWTQKAPMPTARTLLGVGVVNGILYAIGGSDGSIFQTPVVEAYDPVTNTWRSRAPLPAQAGRATMAVAAVNGRLYAVGGFSVYSGANSTVFYDPAIDRWTVGRPYPEAIQELAVGVINGIIYFAGGSCYDSVYSAVNGYIPP